MEAVERPVPKMEESRLMPLLTSENITIERNNTPVLKLPDFSVERGEQVLLLGPSGSGKTTLLSVLAGLLSPASGKVYLEGQDLYAMPAQKLDILRGQSFGLIFQTLHLLPTLTLRQNIEIAAQLRKIKLKRGQVNDVLASLGLENKSNRKPDALSQGEQQRAAIARATINHPAIILADEPTSALDDENAERVADLLIKSAQKTNSVLIIATHDARLLPRFSKIITLDKDISK